MLVYLPIDPGFVTKILIVAPERSRRRSSLRIRTWRDAVADRELALNGHPRPLHLTVTVAPAGALTDRTRKRVPERPMRPAIRTSGKGFSNRSCGPSLGTWGAVVAGVGELTTIVCVAIENAPSVSVTRTLTLKLPVGYECVTLVPPVSKLPSPSRSQSTDSMFLSGSSEVEKNVTCCSAMGIPGR